MRISQCHVISYMARAVSILAATGSFGLLVATGDAEGEDYRFGTGFFVHPDGFLLTNEHVIEGAKEVSVVTSQGRSLPGTRDTSGRIQRPRTDQDGSYEPPI